MLNDNLMPEIVRSIPCFNKKVEEHMANLNCHQSWMILTSGFRFVIENRFHFRREISQLSDNTPYMLPFMRSGLYALCVR